MKNSISQGGGAIDSTDVNRLKFGKFVEGNIHHEFLHQHLIEAIATTLQNYQRNCEIICIDDGSTLAFIEGAKIAEIPVRHHSRRYGQSKYGLDRTFRVIMDLLTIWL